MKSRAGFGWMPVLACGLALAGAASTLAGCGGSDSGSAGADSIAPPGAGQIAAAPCARCRSGFVSGVAVDGGAAIGGAEVQIADAAGQTVRGTTDAVGRFELPIGALSGALLVRVTGDVAGEPTRLHGALRLGEAGRQYAAVTPVSELIVADAMGGVPDTLWRAGRVDFNRLAGEALPQATQRVRSRLQGVLDAAGVAAELDLRIAMFDAPAAAAAASAGGATPANALAKALAWMNVQAGPVDYQVRHAGMAPEASIRFDPVGGDGGTPLPALAPETLTRLNAALDALAGVDARLAALAASFSAGLPDVALLEPHLAADFQHRGLDRETYITRVLRRADAADEGAFSLVGAHWGAARLLAVDGAGRLRVAWPVLPRAPWLARAETGWFERDSSARWLWRGDGALPAAQLRWALSLGPAPLPAGELRARPGVVCSVLTLAPLNEQCLADAAGGGSGGAGQFDFGSAQDARFGLLGLYRSTQGDALERRAEYARQSVLLATPSARVQLLLLLAIDARAVDTRARQVRVVAAAEAGSSSGLAWTMYRPASEAGVPRFAHWSFDPSGQEDWHAVEPGRCEGTALADAPAEVCQQAWLAAQRLGTWRVQVLDAAGALLQDGPLRLARSAPLPQAALAAREQLFARWDLAGRSDRQPTLERINGLASTSGVGDALWLDWPWLRAADAGVLPHRVQIEWQRAHPARQDSTETVRRALMLPAAGVGAGTLVSLAVTARAGFVGTWLAVRLEAIDALGTRLWHTVSPANPY